MALPIPNVPTDNLYKFMAISGLLLSLFCIAFFLTTAQKHEEHLYAAAIQNIHVDDVLEDLKTDLSSGHRTEDQLEEAFNNYQKQYKLHTETTARVLQDSPLQKLKILNTGIYFGMLISIFGFFLWYMNVQRHHDKILAIKVNKELLMVLPVKEPEETSR